MLAQSDVLARRFPSLARRGAFAAGNLKIDAPPPPVNDAELKRLEAALAGRPVLVAASTHDGEEADRRRPPIAFWPAQLPGF